VLARKLKRSGSGGEIVPLEGVVTGAEGCGWRGGRVGALRDAIWTVVGLLM